MTWDEALRRAHEALGCQKVLIAKPRCDLHVQLWPCDQSRAVADLLLAVAREERAAVISDLEYLAEARRDYSGDELINHQVATASNLARYLRDPCQAWGWLPSWRWDEWRDRHEEIR